MENTHVKLDTDLNVNTTVVARLVVSDPKVVYPKQLLCTNLTTAVQLASQLYVTTIMSSVEVLFVK